MTGEGVERLQTSLFKVRENTEATGKITQSVHSILGKIATAITRCVSSPTTIRSVLTNNKRSDSAAENAGTANS